MKRVSLLLVLTTMACNRGETAKTAAAPPPIGNAARGQQLAGQYGCNVCHIVPGVDGPQGALGPSLQGVGARPAISLGMVPNTPENMVRFIQNPAAMNPQSSMPPMGMPENDAKDLAAYLLTLK
jgi:cytochrome c